MAVARPALVAAVISWFAAQSVFAQFVTPPTDLIATTGHLDIPVRYKQVPDGICETTPGVKTFSGYVDIEEDEHIFFWFFEARNVDPTTAPLMVWINGGPGSSSMIGIFQEIGPCSINSTGDVVDNPYAWNSKSNVLVIDQPVGTGFSYSTAVPAHIPGGYAVQLPNNASCPPGAAKCGTYSDPNVATTANSTQAAAPGFWKTLQGFTGAFPQYASGDLHFSSESYGGKWAPAFVDYIHAANAALPAGARELVFKSVLLGNGWYDPLLQFAAYYNFTVSPGNTYDVVPYDEAQQLELYNAVYGPGNCRDLVEECYATGRNDVCAYADSFCVGVVELALDDAVGRDEYDIRYLEDDPFPYEFYGAYLNRPDVLAAVGAYVNYSAGSDTVFRAFTYTGDDSRDAGVMDVLRGLVAQGVYVVLYAGDADYICNWLGAQAVANALAMPGYDTAGYTDMLTSDGLVKGAVKQAGNFAFARVYYAGHEVPFYQPQLSLELFERVIAGADVATGGVAVGGNYSTVGTAESTFREGNATVQFEVVPESATYNTTTGAPNPWVPDGTVDGAGAVARRSVGRSVGRSGRAGRASWREMGRVNW